MRNKLRDNINRRWINFKNIDVPKIKEIFKNFVKVTIGTLSILFFSFWFGYGVNNKTILASYATYFIIQEALPYIKLYVLRKK